MLIIPAEHPLDWKRPPVITLLLILLNCLIAYQSGDGHARTPPSRVTSMADCSIASAI